MAEEDPIKPSFPTGRIKKIVKFDKDITRISSDALHLVSAAAELFLRFLADKSAAAAERKRKTVKLEHLVAAVKRHRPTKEFLLDELAVPLPPSNQAIGDRTAKSKGKEKVKDVPRHTRRIDSFFKKPKATIEDDDDEEEEDVLDDVGIAVDNVVDDEEIEEDVPDDVGNAVDNLVDVEEIEEEEDVPDDVGNEAIADDDAVEEDNESPK